MDYNDEDIYKYQKQNMELTEKITQFEEQIETFNKQYTDLQS